MVEACTAQIGMTLGEAIDAAILFVIVVWAFMDRCSVYVRKPPREHDEQANECGAVSPWDRGHDGSPLVCARPRGHFHLTHSSACGYNWDVEVHDEVAP